MKLLGTQLLLKHGQHVHVRFGESDESSMIDISLDDDTGHLDNTVKAGSLKRWGTFSGILAFIFLLIIVGIVSQRISTGVEQDRHKDSTLDTSTSFDSIPPEENTNNECALTLPRQLTLSNNVNITGQRLEHNGCYYEDASSVNSLSLERLFPAYYLRNLLDFMPNLDTLVLNFSSNPCPRSRNDKIRHANIRTLIVLNAPRQDWNCVYDFLRNSIGFHLNSIELRNLVVVDENENSIGGFLKQCSPYLRSLSIRNGTFSRTSVMFNSLSFPKLYKAELELNPRYASLAPGNLLSTFSIASPKLKQLSTNIRCTMEERDSYLQNWKFMKGRLICDLHPGVKN